MSDLNGLKELKFPAAETSKIERASGKDRTELLARTFARYVLTRRGYNRVFLLSKKGHEAAGIVDLVAIKKRVDTEKKLDATDIILIQVKGNGKVKADDRTRLSRAIEKVHVEAGVIEYLPGRMPTLEMLPEAIRAASAPAGTHWEDIQDHLRNAEIVRNEPFQLNDLNSDKCVTKRGGAARRAWKTRRRT